MKRGGGLHPARPDCCPPTERPRATQGELIAASVECLSRQEGLPPCLPTSPPLGGTLEVHRTFWRIPFPRHACTFLVLGLRLESQSSAGLRMQPHPRSLLLVWPGLLHGTGCLSARAVGTGFPTILWCLCLGPGCGWVWVSVTPPVLAGVLGGCVWVRFVVSSLFCRQGLEVFAVGLGFWPAPHLSWLGIWDVRGCVRAPPAPCRSRSRCAVWACVLGSGFRLRLATPRGGVGVCVCSRARPSWSPVPPGWGCCAGVCGWCRAPPLLAGALGCVFVCARAPLVPRLSWLGCAVWACVLGPGPPFLVGLSGCVFVFGVSCFGFVVSAAGCPCPWSCGPCPPIPSLAGWVAGSFFFPAWCVSARLGSHSSRWAAAPGLVLPVLAGWSPCTSLGGPVFRAFRVGGLAASCGVGGRFASCGPFSRPPPCFFWGGVYLFLPLPSLGWRTHWPAFSVVFRVAVGGSVLFGRVPAPWVVWVMYTLGSAPLPAGLRPGSAGWAAAPGGFVWLWVRRLGLSVSFLLRGASFNLLGGPPPLLPGARWPRVWPAVAVCGVLVRRLPGCAVDCFG